MKQPKVLTQHQQIHLLATFYLNFCITLKVILLNNPVKLSLAKEIAIFVRAFLPKLPNHKSKDPPD